MHTQIHLICMHWSGMQSGMQCLCLILHAVCVGTRRVQDEPAARLYQRCGFQEVASDTFLVRFLGMDQRRLLRKVLPRQQPQAAPAL